MEERGRWRRRGGGEPEPGPRRQVGNPRWRGAGEDREGNHPRGAQSQRGRSRGRGRRQVSNPRQNEDGSDNEKSNRGKNSRSTGENARRSMGFLALQDIANAEANDIILKIKERNISFMKLIETTVDSDKLDTYVLILRILSKCSTSAFDQLKLNLILDISNSKFIGNLRNYMMDLPYAERKMRNKLYWENQQQFWEDFIIMCQYIIEASPTTAMQKCRSLIENTSQTCLEGLLERHNFLLSEDQQRKLIELRQRLADFEKEKTSQTVETKKPVVAQTAEESEPPDNFRNLNVVPTHDDLLGHKPFVRPNIIAGAYHDIDHYLDVQFRLLREDCFGPLRDGIIQFIEDPNRRRFDNVRIFTNVQFIGPYVSNNKIGSIIEFDEKTQKRFSKINWAHSKRFIFGSLLLFTKDNCRSFLTATILERDEKLLAKGKVPVSIVGANTNIADLFNGDSYVMIESEVYFEPYFHVLKALQDPKFSEHLAFAKYIVDVNAEQNYPSYLTPQTEYIVTKNVEDIKFNVMQESTWPTKENLGLNESQYDAYKLALTHEFVVIQGPPGTGKTFLGVQIAETLLNNEQCPMLVICYTNHALDQFLEGIMSVTSKRVVRIGGQSRNEAMNKINLSKLRRENEYKGVNFFEERNRFKWILRDLQKLHQAIDSLSDGIINYDYLKKYSRNSVALEDFYKVMRSDVKSDPLEHWLFEGMEYVDIENLTDDDLPENTNADDDNQDRNKNDIILDDFDDIDETTENEKTKLSFSFNRTDALIELKGLQKLLRRKAEGITVKSIEDRVVDLTSRIIWFDHWSSVVQKDIRNNRPVRLKQDMSRIHMHERWILYYNWAKRVSDALQKRVKPMEELFQPASEAYEEARMIVDLQLLRKMSVIGMTTSGAARLRKILKGIAPRIVIVEEAAEVLEQHIITALTKDCKHLILIGDHQQLRPSAAHVKLARHYNLEVSLFERMITNGMHSRRLRVQHRMRPEIATLIVPHIYTDLENHPSVKTFPCVRGINENVFFFNHDYPEKEEEDGCSKSNPAEADIALGLCNYLIQQRYEPQDVTVLAAYSGQMFYMRKQRKNYAHLSKVKITVVDNYQGEESKIIILSLVRNNTEGKIGFLGTENRICVALSRAREGFYILGDMDLLKQKSPLWEKIASTLESQMAIGSAFILRCENHPEQITSIKSAEDFNKVPEGGCLQKCKYNLKCGHRCSRVCHSYDTGHDETQCFEQCERVLCDLGHVCVKKCHEECGECKQIVEKLLPCGHRARDFCHLEPERVLCFTRVKVTLPNCGHEAMKMCYKEIDKVTCDVPCEYRVEPCGHKCKRNCHVTDDPNHEKYCCNMPCAKAKRGCKMNLIGDRGDHQCLKKCYEECDPCNVQVTKRRSHCRHTEKVACSMDVDEKPCFRKCARTMECGHHCKKLCHEQCGDCKQMVMKPVPGCNHQIKIECMVEVTQQMCNNKCERILPCGHKCSGRCGDPCTAENCTQLISEKIKSPCGHLVMLPCNLFKKELASGLGSVEPDVVMSYCLEPCRAELACEHPCAGSCADCRQGRVHRACTHPCQRLNICGHQCEEPCNKVCPPCQRPCEVRCEHSRCRRLCGQPCVPCNENCSRACEHGECTRRCGEVCSRSPCEAACVRALPCGHPCRGLCGEPCPEICNVCRPEQFPVDFLGDPYQDDDKFIKLEDCSHVLDIDSMDSLMTGDTQTVEIKTCPFCRKPIINTQRYKDYVNNLIKTEINPVKEKVYGDKEIIKTRKAELFHGVTEVFPVYEKIIMENSHIKRAYDRLVRETKKLKSASLLYVDMLLQYLNILVMILEKYKKYLESDLNFTCQDEVDKVMELLCVSLSVNSKKISVQLQKDLGNEIKRLTALIQFATIMSQSSATSPQIKEAIAEAKQVVLVRGIFDENAASEALKGLEKAVKLSGIVTKEERDLIVKAIGSKAGSWYKCPNGHFYSIADCGGAMEVSKCADCGAAIGGESHALLSSNTHAGEVDGSSRAAWPIYNDMRNFRF